MFLWCCTCTASSLPIHIPSSSSSAVSHPSQLPDPPPSPPEFCPLTSAAASPIPYRRRRVGLGRLVPPHRTDVGRTNGQKREVRSSHKGGSRRKRVTHTLSPLLLCMQVAHTQREQTDRKRKAPHIHLPPLSQTGRGFFVNITISKMAVFLSEI